MSKPVACVGRRVDQDLWDRAKDWAASQQPFHWISLLSAPGRGNTEILKRFLARAATDHYGLSEIRLIYAEGRDRFDERPPSTPSDLAEPLTQFHDTRGPIDDFVQRVRDCTPRQRLLLLLVGGGALFLFVSLLALDKYTDDAVMPAASLSYWSDFATKWVPANLGRLSIWFLLAAGGWLLTLVVNRILPRPSRGTPQPAAHSTESLLDLIRQSAIGKRGVILAIDNAAALSPMDCRALVGLSEAAASGRRRTMRANPRVLVITVDPEETGNRVLATARNVKPVRLKVEPLTAAELESIIRLRWPHAPRAELLERLNEAQLSLKSALDADAREARAAAVSEALDNLRRNSIQIVFDLYKLVIVWAARRTPRVSKSDLYTWLSGLDPELLQIFRWEGTQNPADLVRQFSRSLVAQLDGETLHLDQGTCRLVGDWARANDPDLLLAAHCFWGFNLSQAAERQPTGVQGPPDATRRTSLREAGWHLARVSMLMTEEVEELFRRFPVPAERQSRWFALAVSGLLASAAIRQEEGEFEEAESLTSDALEWAEGAPASRIDVAERVAALRWADYWYRGHATTWESLQGLDPAVRARAVWTSNNALRSALRCEPIEPAVGDPPVDAGLRNVRRLAEVLTRSRVESGFLATALKDGTITVDPPDEAPSHRWSEFRLRQLQVKQALLQRDDPRARLGLERYKMRLAPPAAEQTVVSGILEHFDRAQYLHLLLWLNSHAAGGLAPDDPLLPSPIVTSPGEAADVAAILTEQARRLYVSVMHDTSLLDMKPLLAEVSFQLGELLKQYAVRTDRRADRGWETWEQWFSMALSVDEELGWPLRAPVIHHARWEYFRHEDRNTAVTDAYNTLQAIIRASFPMPIRLEWHLNVSAELNNVGDSAADRKRSAELHEQWAWDLCALPEAADRREFKHALKLEQSHTLMFAAQAYRNIHDRSEADRVLSQAEALYQEASTDPTTADEPPEMVRALGLRLRLQRVWLVGEIESFEERYNTLLMALWPDVKTSDALFSNVLATLTRHEWRLGTLNAPWPSDNPPVDPANANASIPAAWLKTQGCTIRNRFEFRLMQLLLAGCGLPAPRESDVALAAFGHFRRQEHFGEAALMFGQYELSESYCGRENRVTLTQLLRGVRFYFNRCQPQDDREMLALRLLMQFEPAESGHRFAYVALVVKHGALLQRELELQVPGHVDFFHVAVTIQEYLEVLVNRESHAEQVAAHLDRLHIEPKEFAEWCDQEAAAVAEARRILETEPARAAEILLPYLPKGQAGWVRFAELELLYLYVQAVQAAPMDANEARRWMDILQTSALRYVGQFSRTIQDPKVHELAVRLIDVLRHKLIPRAVDAMLPV